MTKQIKLDIRIDFFEGKTEFFNESNIQIIGNEIKINFPDVPSEDEFTIYSLSDIKTIYINTNPQKITVKDLEEIL